MLTPVVPFDLCKAMLDSAVAWSELVDGGHCGVGRKGFVGFRWTKIMLTIVDVARALERPQSMPQKVSCCRVYGQLQ